MTARVARGAWRTRPGALVRCQTIGELSDSFFVRVASQDSYRFYSLREVAMDSRGLQHFVLVC